MGGLHRGSFKLSIYRVSCRTDAVVTLCLFYSLLCRTPIYALSVTGATFCDSPMTGNHRGSRTCGDAGRGHVHAQRPCRRVRTLRRPHCQPRTRLLERVCLCKSGEATANRMTARVTHRLTQDFLIGLVIWSCIDPTNFSAPPAAAPWIVSFV